MSQAAAKEILYTVFRHLYVGEPIQISLKNIPVYTALYRKSELCVPRNETARLHSQSHIHVSVSDLYITRIGQPILQTDPGNI
jgi:hypothetical protein